MNLLDIKIINDKAPKPEQIKQNTIETFSHHNSNSQHYISNKKKQIGIKKMLTMPMYERFNQFTTI